MIVFSTVLSGSVSDFNQDSFKERLASTLSGVAARDITLTVTAASVSVTAAIVTANTAMANLTMQTLNAYTPQTLTAALGGLRVESILPATVMRQNRPVNSTAIVAGESGRTALTSANEGPTGMLMVVLAIIGSLLAVTVCVCYFACRSGRNTAPHRNVKAFDSVDARSSAEMAHIKGTNTGNGGIGRARAANKADKSGKLPTFYGPAIVAEDQDDDEQLRL